MLLEYGFDGESVFLRARKALPLLGVISSMYCAQTGDIQYLLQTVSALLPRSVPPPYPRRVEWASFNATVDLTMSSMPHSLLRC